MQRGIYEQVHAHAGRVVIGRDHGRPSVKTTERGGGRGFNGYTRVKGRRRHILVDTFGFPIASRVEPASISDRHAGALLLGGLAPLFPRIQTVMTDAEHESKKLSRELFRENGVEAEDRKTTGAGVPDQRSDVGCGTILGVARTQPAVEQSLRLRR